MSFSRQFVRLKTLFSLSDTITLLFVTTGTKIFRNVLPKKNLTKKTIHFLSVSSSARIPKEHHSEKFHLQWNLKLVLFIRLVFTKAGGQVQILDAETKHFTFSYALKTYSCNSLLSHNCLTCFFGNQIYI